MLALLALSAALSAPPVQDATRSAPATRPAIAATRIVTPPRVDGLLDDAAWAGEPVSTGEWRSYNPLYGDGVPQRTRVWVAYDADALYFAFQCDDPDPSGIKTSVARRDNFGADDWVGVSLDALGTGQLSYHMMVNPSGVQLDLLNSAAGQEDWTVDWVWESGGRLTATGYDVEIRLPLRSIRFTSGQDVRMGLLFWRRVSRLGMSVAWPSIEPGRWVFETHAALDLSAVEPRLPRDVTPSVTLSGRQRRAPEGSWGAFSGVADTGVSAKVGVSSTVTIDATANPDFSQVESDAYQVEVSQRFPVFFSERRPFFMEGAGIFRLAGSGGDNSLQAAVHTRRIVSPVVGLKLTGSIGRTTVAALSAVDETPGSAGGALGASASRVFTVGRVQYGLGPNTYIGAVVADVEDRPGHNRVIGGDVSLRLSPSQRLNGHWLTSHTQRAGAASATTSLGANVGYSYETRAVTVAGAAEHYGRGFQMDTAFINRVGMTNGWSYVDRSLYPSGQWGWVRRMALFSFTQGGTDRINDGGDFLEELGVRLNFTRQGFLRVGRVWGHEPWAGQRFARGVSRAWGSVQLTRWLKLDGRFQVGRAVFYDPSEPFAGRTRRVNGGLVFQPGGRFYQSASWERVVFERRSTGAREYAVTIVNSRTIYQFTRRLFIRGLAQYDSLRGRLLTDFLLSYEVNPGTIAYIGYGGLSSRASAGALDSGSNTRLVATDRGLLMKVSYVARF